MKKGNKKKDIVIVFSLLISFAIVLLFAFTHLVLSNNKNSSSPDKELLGEEREKVTNEIIGIVEDYISDKKLIKNYLDQKNEKTLTIKEIKENLNLDVSKFEKKEYGCNNEFTTIDFNEDYSKHVISITCSILFKK